MSNDFEAKNKRNSLPLKMYYSAKWNNEAHSRNPRPMITDFHFLERLHYGVIDNNNNSIIPNTDMLVTVDGVEMFDLVAEKFKGMKKNLSLASSRGYITQEGAVFGSIVAHEAYKDPKKKYGEYLGNILRFYNEKHIPTNVGTSIIQSYEDYVKHFLELIFDLADESPITLTRWNTTFSSNILDSGLAIKYADIDYQQHQRKIDEILRNSCYGYFSDLCLNRGFSISHHNPQILVFDIASPANTEILIRKGILILDDFFEIYYKKTFTIDLELLFNNINIYYNKYVSKNSLVVISKIKCGKIVTEFKNLLPINQNERLINDEEQMDLYVRIRNHEEGSPFNQLEERNIIRRAKKIIKTLDKLSAMSYINDKFRDQVWNKDFGYHDRIQSLKRDR